MKTKQQNIQIFGSVKKCNLNKNNNESIFNDINITDINIQIPNTLVSGCL